MRPAMDGNRYVLAVTNSANLTVNQNVVIATGPQNQTVCPGANPSFSVSATGTGLSYQWFKGASALPGQTGSSLSLNNVSANDASAYSVTVSGVCGNSVTSSATLAVNVLAYLAGARRIDQNSFEVPQIEAGTYNLCASADRCVSGTLARGGRLVLTSSRAKEQSIRGSTAASF